MSGNKINILITGGLGNLGSWITDYFSGDARYDVTVLSKNDRALSITHPFKKIFCDITDGAALKESIAGSEFDYIIHLASLNETFLPDYAKKALQINAYGTRNLLEACKEKSVKKIIYMSTFHVYGKEGGEITEQSSIAPKNDYALTHYFAEEYIKMFSVQHGLPYVIFRLSNSYGCPKDLYSSKWYLLFNDLCKQAVQEKKIEFKTNGTALRDFVWMQDVCTVVQEVLENEKANNGIYNLGSGISFSLAAIAGYIREAYQEKYSANIAVHLNETDATVYPDSLYFRIDKLKKITGIEPSFAFADEAKKIFHLIDSVK
jgi:UDP-glucose 4-epimerase